MHPARFVHRHLVVVSIVMAAAVLGMAPAGHAAGIRMANLQVTSIKVTPSTVAPTAGAVVRATIRNAGTGQAAASRTIVVLSRNTVRDARDRALVQLPTPARAPLTAGVLQRRVIVPAGTVAGRWYVIACADVLRIIRETNDRDNCRAAAFTVAAPPAPPGPGGPGTGGTGGTTPTTDPNPNPNPSPTPTPAAPAVGTAPPAGQPPTNPGITFKPDNAAVQQELAAAGDILLERASFSESGVTATYWRIWLYGNGQFVFNEIGWNNVSGEICTKSHRGTWSFLEGWTFPEFGGGIALKAQINTPTLSGPEVFVAAKSEPNAVFVGTSGTRYERNPNMRDQCG